VFFFFLSLISIFYSTLSYEKMIFFLIQIGDKRTFEFQQRQFQLKQTLL